MKLLALILLASTALAQYGTGLSADALNNTRVGGPWNSDLQFYFTEGVATTKHTKRLTDK